MPERAGDLISHAGERVFDVVLLGILGAPEHLQVTGHRAGGLDDGAVRADGLVQRAQHLGLRGQRPVIEVVGLVDHLVPSVLVLGVLGGVGRVDVVAGQFGGQRLEAFAGVGDQHDPGVLGRVQRGDVQVHERHVRVLERGLRGGGEVAVPGADPDDRRRRPGPARWRPGSRSIRRRRRPAGGPTGCRPCRPGCPRPGSRSPSANRASSSVASL